MIRYAAYQPYLFPPLYVLQRMKSCSHWLTLDTLTMSKYPLNRLMLVGANGVFYSTLPIQKEDQQVPMNQITPIDLRGWCNQLQKQVQAAYGKCYGYKAVKLKFDFLLNVLVEKPRTFADTADLTSQWAIELLRERVLFRSLSLFDLPVDATDRLVGYGKMLRGSTSQEVTYLTGRPGFIALDGQKFESAAVRVEFQDYTVPEYEGPKGVKRQFHELSYLDPLMIGGPDLLKEVLK